MTRLAIPIFVMAAATATQVIAKSATDPVDPRYGKLEKEVRAMQRVVFPQGVPVQPDLNAVNRPLDAAGSTATAPIADLSARVDALEKQVAALTGASEQNTYRLRQIEAAQTAMQGRLTALESGAAPTSGAATNNAQSTPQAFEANATEPNKRPPRSTTSGPAGTGPTMAEPGAQKPASGKANPARKATVAAVEMPSTGDTTEDDYTYGFRLYTAGLYPEAEAKLKEFAAKYPSASRRWSYAQNLLGRAYYDEGKPALASVAFYDNYQKAPQGERVVDSLTWLGQALIKLKKPTDACKVYGVLSEDYAGKLNGEQRVRVAKGRVDAKCAA